MDAAAIIALVTKGIAIATSLIAAVQSAAPAYQALINLFNRSTAITQSDIDKVEAILDGLIDQFNLAMPAAQPGDPDYVA